MGSFPTDGSLHVNLKVGDIWSVVKFKYLLIIETLLD